MKREELHLLIDRWLDGDISELELSALQAELLSDPEALELYVDLAQIHSMLGQKQVSELPSAKVVPMERILDRQKRRNVKVAVMAAVASLVMLLVTMRLFFVEEPQIMLSFESAPGTRCVLTHSQTGEVPEGNVFGVGSRLQLSQGTVELTFASGVKSVVTAPADMTLHAEDALFMGQGKAWFQVPPQAVGFQVKTKELEIVDLGTEFGVSADADEHDEIHVFKGKVEATAKSLRHEQVILSAGDARRVDHVGRLIDIPLENDRFITSLPDSLPFLHWGFERLDGAQLAVQGIHPDVTGLMSKLESDSGDAGLVPGVHGKALSLDGVGSYMMSNWPGFEGGRPRTVSFWIKLPEDGLPVSRCSILSWGDTWTDFARWQIMVKRRNRLDAGSEAHLAFGYGFSEGSQSVDTPLEYGQWHHIVVSYSGQPNERGDFQEDVYVNGEMVNLQLSAKRKNPVDTSIVSKGAKPLSLGVTLRGKQKRHYFKGLIDELYIFEGHMTEKEVADWAEKQRVGTKLPPVDQASLKQ